MALPINQPVPEILRGWTVARSIPAGKDAVGRIIQDLNTPTRANCGGQTGNCPDRAGNPSECYPDSGRAQRPAGRFEAKHCLEETGSPGADPPSAAPGKPRGSRRGISYENPQAHATTGM